MPHIIFLPDNHSTVCLWNAMSFLAPHETQLTRLFVQEDEVDKNPDRWEIKARNQVMLKVESHLFETFGTTNLNSYFTMKYTQLLE